MGLAGFNRARRSRLEVEKHEAERFKRDNEARWASHHATDTNRRQEQKDLEKGRELEQTARQEIGAKAEEGIKMGERRGGIADLPLRQDHAAEIAGRTLENNQEPKDPVARVEERIPSGTATEKMVEHTQVDQKGPSAALVKDVALENTPEAQREDTRRTLETEQKVAQAEREKNVEHKEARQKATTADSSEKTETETAAQKEARAEEARAAKEATLPAAGKSAGAGTTAPSSSQTKKTSKSASTAAKKKASK